MALVGPKRHYSVPLAYCDQKYQKFECMGQVYVLSRRAGFMSAEIDKLKTHKTSFCYFKADW